MAWLLYGKRTGLVNTKTGKPEYDATFRALNAKGVRVSKLVDAMAYAEKSDIEAILNKPKNKEAIDAGLVEFDIRPAK
jgi:hypothetical protein